MIKVRRARGSVMGLCVRIGRLDRVLMRVMNWSRGGGVLVVMRRRGAIRLSVVCMRLRRSCRG